jgi:hypothetical protein
MGAFFRDVGSIPLFLILFVIAMLYSGIVLIVERK